MRLLLTYQKGQSSFDDSPFMLDGVLGVKDVEVSTVEFDPFEVVVAAEDGCEERESEKLEGF
jgi:hypothetical protein